MAMSCKLATLIQARKYSKFFTNQGPSLQPLAADSYRGLYSNVLQCAVYLPTYVHKINYQLNSWMGAYWKLFIGTRECFFDHFYFFLTFFQFRPIIEIWFCKQNCKMAYVLVLPMDICEILMKFVSHILKALDARKTWNNHKSYITILDKYTQRWTLRFVRRTLFLLLIHSTIY